MKVYKGVDDAYEVRIMDNGDSYIIYSEKFRTVYGRKLAYIKFIQKQKALLDDWKNSNETVDDLMGDLAITFKEFVK